MKFRSSERSRKRFAFRIERAFSKDRILELYLNEIYLGSGSYGCAAAALNYFDKSLGELTIAEAAFLAALPKAPNNYHPIRKRQAAIGRRNWVIGRMYDEGFIDLETARKARREFLRFEIVAILRLKKPISLSNRFAATSTRFMAIEVFMSGDFPSGQRSTHAYRNSRRRRCVMV